MWDIDNTKDLTLLQLNNKLESHRLLVFIQLGTSFIQNVRYIVCYAKTNKMIKFFEVTDLS